MSTTTKKSAVVEGIDKAWSFYLYDHPISVPQTIEDAVTKAFAEWLDDHSDELIEAIATKVAARSTPPHAPA